MTGTKTYAERWESAEALLPTLKERAARSEELRRIPEETIGETLALYETLMAEAEDDVMAGDVRGEIEAGVKS